MPELATTGGANASYDSTFSSTRTSAMHINAPITNSPLKRSRQLVCRISLERAYECPVDGTGHGHR